MRQKNPAARRREKATPARRRDEAERKKAERVRRLNARARAVLAEGLKALTRRERAFVYSSLRYFLGAVQVENAELAGWVDRLSEMRRDEGERRARLEGAMRMVLDAPTIEEFTEATEYARKVLDARGGDQ